MTRFHRGAIVALRLGPPEINHAGELGPNEPRPSLIVGIGASAGGLEALERFFSTVPSDSGLAFVVVQHLAPHQPSVLAQILAQHSKLSVIAVTNELPVQADRVYVIQPGTLITLALGALRVTPLEEGRRGQIDALFRSLADELGPRAVGILLSGTGTDGTEGLRAVVEREGLTIVQAPETAKYDAMARSALGAGVVQLVLPIEKMMPVLLERSRPLLDAPSPPLPVPSAAMHLAPRLPPALFDRRGALEAENAAISAAFERLMLQEYVPPGAVVNERGDILCIAGLTGKYLQPPAGVLSTNILDIASASLRVDLRTALRACARTGRWIVREGVTVEVDGAAHQLRLTVRPMPGVRHEGLFAVILQERSGLVTVEPEEVGEPVAGTAIEHLESELRTTRAMLRANIEELESANEELLSTSEEMRRAKEELQSSQEELKRVNEEMATLSTELSRTLADMTLLKRAEAERRASEEKYRGLFESIDQAFCVIEVLLDGDERPKDYRFVEVNPAFERQIGLFRGVGRRLREVAPVHEEEWFRLYGEVARTGEPVRFETSASALGRRYEMYAFRVDKPAERRVAVLFNDITERTHKEAERDELLDDLRFAQKQMGADLDGMGRLLKIGALFLEDGNLECILGEVIDAAIAITGADYGNVQLLDPASGELKIVVSRGFSGAWLEFWNTQGVGQGACASALAVGERVIVEDVETCPIYTGTASLEVMLAEPVRAVQSTPIFSRSGVALGVWSTHYKEPCTPDPRSLKLMDLLARQLADILERLSAEGALREANQRLIEADERKNHFLGMLSHELRNPLSAIQTSLHLLDLVGTGDARARRAATIVQRQVRYLTHMVDDLLDVTRLSNGKIQLVCETLELSQLASRTAEDLRGIFDDRGVELAVTLFREEIWVSADPTRLSQVIGNLLQNAAKFTPRGGKTQLVVEKDSEGREAQLHVTDTGPGIPAELLSWVFEPFAQVDISLDRKRGGLGLGLAVVKGLTEMHGGSVRAVSGGTAKGTTFTVTLPTVDKP